MRGAEINAKSTLNWPSKALWRKHLESDRIAGRSVGQSGMAVIVSCSPSNGICLAENRAIEAWSPQMAGYENDVFLLKAAIVRAGRCNIVTADYTHSIFFFRSPRMRQALVVLATVMSMTLAGRLAAAQPAAAQVPLRVFIDCDVEGCDFDFFRAEIPFVDYVRDRQDAALHVLVTNQATGGGGLDYTVNFIGLRQLAGIGDTLSYVSPNSATLDDRRRGLAGTIKLGLVRYVARTGGGARLRISDQGVASAAPGTASPKRDPWNLWVFRVGANGNFSGEQSFHATSLRGSTSANRTTEAFKIRVTTNANYNENKYTFSDGSRFASYSHSYGASELAVKSLGPHWSAGQRASMNSSTFLNQKITFRAAPAVEYNIFPYSESTRRLLTAQYAVGLNAFRYDDTTIFNKISELRPDQTLTLSLGLKQPWGSVNTSLTGASYLDDFSKNRAELFNSFDIRLFKGFSINMFVSASRLRDQLYLARGASSDEDVLVRQRQLATSYSYFAGVGLSYTFGSILNNVVNPRFEGASGGSFFFF